MPFFMERKNEGRIKLTIFSRTVVGYRFGLHKRSVLCPLMAQNYHLIKYDSVPQRKRKLIPRN